MAAEQREYLLPAHHRPASVVAAVAGALGADVDPPRTERVTLLDTFDWRVHGAGGWITVSVSDGDGDGRATLSWRALGTGRSLGSVTLDAVPRLARDLPPGPLRDRLAPVLDVRALLPVADLRTEIHALAVRNHDGKCVARVVVEAHDVVEAGGNGGPTRPPTRLPARLRVVPVRGYDGARRRVDASVAALASDLGLEPASDDAFTAVLAAAGRSPGDQGASVSAPEAGDSAAMAWIALLRSLLGVMRANERGSVDGVDPEFLHDLRVALRRSRSALRHGRGVLPAPLLDRFRPELRWLQQETGPARDMDVWVLGLEADLAGMNRDDAEALAPFARLLDRRRREAHAHVVSVLEGARYRSLVEDWARTLAELATGPAGDDEAGEWGDWPQHAAAPVADVAAARLRRQYRRLVHDGSVITDSSPDTALHDLRKSGKEVRYLLDLFGPVLPPDALGTLARDLKALQEALGTFQDTAVQLDALQHFADDLVAEEPQAPAAILAMAPMVERIRRRQVEARADFARRFARVAAARTRRRIDGLPG